MKTKTSGAENGIGVEPRTRRACVESMTVVPHGDATGMFDVYSGTNAEPYVVDLAGSDGDRCTCPDVQHTLETGERCKHARRVRLEFGLVPFADVPTGVRSAHGAPMDVELARRRLGIDTEPESKSDPITVDDAKPARAVRIATDGGVVVSEPETRGSDGEDVGTDLPADALLHLHGVVAETTSTIDDLPDFDVYCVAVEFSTQHIRRLAAREGGQ
jgi:hypothetical protein